MKSEVKVDTSKPTLEQRISSMLSATDVTSTEVSALLALVETEVSEATKRVELERAISNFDVSAAETSRVMTEN